MYKSYCFTAHYYVQFPFADLPVAGTSGEGEGREKRKHGGFRNVDLWTAPLTDYFLQVMKEHFPQLTGKSQAKCGVKYTRK